MDTGYNDCRTDALVAELEKQRVLIETLPPFAKIILHLGETDFQIEYQFKGNKKRWSEKKPT